ncbi:hypothetical protein [Tahibacter soli]|jgi:hypothetical protein|uniref:Uncharacterized protein n=1 Tax=Tahibacter soli TaxID=2983605 RepID=A0A9X3YN81_9GAMM|nr:hypothetical protein [Tahibacter soli]MDC8014792.1 hypothetical protein [Tahibacter soli]
MDADFQDIRIVDLDLSKTTWSRVHETLRIMFLKLDREPPDNDWLRLFFEERETRIVARRRGLWIEDGYISFDSLPNEVEAIHLPDIRRSLDYANREYRKLVAQKAVQRAGQQREIADERSELVALRERVRAALAGKPPPAATAEPAPIAVPMAATAAVPAKPAEPVASATAEPAADIANEFDARRESLKQRFRLALNHQDQELKRGND